MYERCFAVYLHNRNPLLVETFCFPFEKPDIPHAVRVLTLETIVLNSPVKGFELTI
jgi:hypothetical protein